jgi:hypothetical protein
MHRETLEPKLKRAKLVIGAVEDTCATFFRDYSPAPIGCVFHDLDFYSSTSEALTLFDADASHFLPRVFMYFDDIIGDDVWLCNEYTGERLSIAEFNQNHGTQKICKNYYWRARHPTVSWSYQIYIYHDFKHPRYQHFIADKEQNRHQGCIKLK